jgi:hypothetical protein
MDEAGGDKAFGWKGCVKGDSGEALRIVERKVAHPRPA